ncbi:MAG: DUF1345 domain-containing protein [Candidatus Eremiobacteraeota bacterium]|nr:DUF1345 domain-containing protein [Candidatus Eremiobacteraeota bacterium]MBC5827520.1 DUF1345 domain-containing protein [Candidatus Eremiobacteraeota bacterium]
MAWGVTAAEEPRWRASLAVLVALLLYVTLPQRLTIGPQWLAPIFELALLIPLSVLAPNRTSRERRWQRNAAITLIAIVNAANLVSLVLLVHFLVAPGAKATGSELIVSSIEIWLTNVIVFALWYWELDRGGPHERTSEQHRAPDFLFPQMVTPDCAPPDWSPTFVDYLFVSFTNATAFSPTDTMPLSPAAKALMIVQAIASLLTVALVAARAVNILG